MSNQNLENKSIDELREMKAKGEAELKVLHNKSKYYDSQINLLTRKERTHRLCRFSADSSSRSCCIGNGTQR